MFLAVIDDYSKACAIIPMSAKSSAFEYIRLTVAKLERQLGNKVRFIRSDGGTEFGSGEAKKWYADLGIQHQVTPSYTPELNGTAERFIRTVKDMIKAMITDSGLGHDYWDYAARYTAIILMKTSADVNGMTPWKKLTGREPKVESIRRFGESCFMQIPRETRNKSSFEIEKAKAAKLLGQSETVSGWIVKIDDSGRVTHSRDVRTLTGRQIEPEGGALPEEDQQSIQDDPEPEHIQLGWPEVEDESVDDVIEEIERDVTSTSGDTAACDAARRRGSHQG